MMLKVRRVAVILSLVVLSFWAGLEAGQGRLFFQKSGAPFQGDAPLGRQRGDSNIDFKLFWDVWERLRVGYIDKSKLDPLKMFYGAVSGMVASLDDPYTVFLTPSQNKETKEELGGVFEGIGAQLGIKDKKIVVVAPLRGLPAEKAGVRSGDYIYKIDGKETAGLTLPEAVAKIRGKKGTKVTLTLIREKTDKPFDVGVVRDTILVKSVEWEIKEGSSSPSRRVAYMRLSRFGDGTNDEWDKAVSGVGKELPRDGSLLGIVLDLRDNPGGYFSSAVYVASEFLSGGVVAKQQNADGTITESLVTRRGKLLDTKLVVLINKGSASAAEILAGAIQERGRAKLVGETSFGKGSVQERQELPGGGGLHITTAKWLLPSGRWINGSGLSPDVVVAAGEEDISSDRQLEEAIRFLGE